MNRRNAFVFAIVAALAAGWGLGRFSAAPAGSPRVSGTLPESSGGPGATTGAVAGIGAAFGSDCEGALVEAINGATNEILVAIYSFTRRSVSSALARAAHRGVKVTVRYDEKSAEEARDMPDTIGFLKRRGVRCEAVGFGDSRARMHHKFTVVDRRRVLTGSYNYTSTATELNRENMVTIESAALADSYAREFAGLRPKRGGE